MLHVLYTAYKNEHAILLFCQLDDIFQSILLFHLLDKDKRAILLFRRLDDVFQSILLF